MSGGFFRGTSADQDTRFSNKQAKLLKTQKFAPELDHLVDMTKVKMDVIRPWIATRATELLGFEDEVLINFVYGLLDGKEVDGKQIQIQLTGFMEKNTGKFMKELWALLLSAQNNASGVPQQLLDAKKEETDRRKAETDRIAQEIQKRKEKVGRELEQEKQRGMDGAAEKSRSANADSGSVSKRSPPRASSVHPEEDREADMGHHSRSKSWGGWKSRSISVSSQSQRSNSPKRRYRSPPRRSISSERRYITPPRRSISPSHRHSPRYNRSPLRRRSPRTRRRSVSLSRNRSPSPIRRRSPYARKRSPSYVQRGSPSSSRRSAVQVRRRSPSPLHHRSPIRRRSLSLVRRRSPFPLRRRSPPPRSPKHRRRSPLHSPRSRVVDCQASPWQRKRSRSPYRSQSPPYPTRRSTSREIDNRINGINSRHYRGGYTSQRSREKRSPLHHALDRKVAERTDSVHKVSQLHRFPISRSTQRDSRNQNNIHDRECGAASDESPSPSESPSHLRRMDPRGNRSRSLSESPVKQPGRQIPPRDRPETSRDRDPLSHAREDAYHRVDSSCKNSRGSPANVQQKDYHAKDFGPEEYSSDRLADDCSPVSQGRAVSLENRKKDYEKKSEEDLPERHKQLVSQSPEGIEYGPGRIVDESYAPDNAYDREQSSKEHARDASSSEKRVSDEQAVKNPYGDGYAVKAERQSHAKSNEYRESHYDIESVKKSRKKVVRSNCLDIHDLDSEETDTHRYREMEKQRHKKSSKHKRDLDDSSESDSQIDDKKEAKRRRKDEKRQRKEERRLRREERHRRKLERRAGKLKVKSIDTVTPPSDLEKNHNDADESDGDAAIRKGPHLSYTEETLLEQKKLEIELREKALESLRAKKAINH
ncbi:serine/arginine repetitive matrix protein 1-like isoform X2 [Phoenix dactylifera]|uniref:Serine/arginine repetitive matrix protein 1-like isoform X2 n=1 Tax=Phoenix dactylifera TaxID=42345 RepID=A0A8B7CNV3_PHODC|nr:serine/arginine repetitive matrix protein 1-like isoform X2 [Phoenix dactylifera]